MAVNCVDQLLFSDGKPLRLKIQDKDRLRVLYLAKHVKGDGEFHQTDGSHAKYHLEIKSCLKTLGLELNFANSYEEIFARPNCNFIFTLFNRAQFRNSEILASCLGEYHRIPYLGSSPSMRGFGDDKHLSKIMFHSLGIPTPQWQVYRSNELDFCPPLFEADRYVVKPNNCSASWGVYHSTSWKDLEPCVRQLLAANHDVIVEEYIPGVDVTVPVLGAGIPWILYPMANLSSDDLGIVSYGQKRGFDPGSSIQFFKDYEKHFELIEYTKKINNMIWPFDYGRFDYRITPSGKIYAFEYNLSCNLGSNRAICQSAKLLGYEQVDLVESILANSLERQRVQFENVIENKEVFWEI